MIKAEIRVGLHTYPFSFPGENSVRNVHAILVDIATGKDVFVGPEGLLDLNTGSYDHIRVWEEASDVQETLEALPASQEIIRGVYSDKVTHLNAVHPFEVAIWEEAGTFYVLPYLLAHEPAITMISKESLEALTQQYAVQTQLTPYKIVLPHGPLTSPEEALAYLADYVAETVLAAETRLPDTQKTAKAFKWKDDDK